MVSDLELPVVRRWAQGPRDRSSLPGQLSRASLSHNCFARDGGSSHPVYAEQTREREEVTADYARPKNPLIIPSSLSLSLFHMHNSSVKDDTVLITLSLSLAPQRTSKEPNPNAMCIKSLESSQRSILDQKAFAPILTVSDWIIRIWTMGEAGLSIFSHALGKQEGQRRGYFGLEYVLAHPCSHSPRHLGNL